MHRLGSTLRSLLGFSALSKVNNFKGFRHVEEFLWTSYANVISIPSEPAIRPENMLSREMTSLCDDDEEPFFERVAVERDERN